MQTQITFVLDSSGSMSAIEDDTRGGFNELHDGFDTKLDDGDRVGLVYPFIFCC